MKYSLCDLQEMWYSKFQVIYFAVFSLLWSRKSIFFNSEKRLLILIYLSRFSVNMDSQDGVFTIAKNGCFQLKCCNFSKVSDFSRRIFIVHKHSDNFIHVNNIGYSGGFDMFFSIFWNTPHRNAKFCMNLDKYDRINILFSEFKNIDFRLHNKWNTAK